MNSKKKNIQKTSGTRNRYKPGQLITICKNVFRIVKNKSGFTGCKYCLHNLHWCYFRLIKKHKG